MRPFSLLIKPAGPDCNVRCEYCFYACKDGLFGSGAHRMSDATLETVTRNFLTLGFPSASFAWQGGEPTLMGLDFFRRATELQQTHGRPGQVVSNALQTNAILLGDDWCRFLHEYNFLVGISLDGPRRFHDHYRLDAAGRGTYDRVMAAIDRCRQHRVEFNILVLVNALNVQEPDAVFDFLREQDFQYLQFIPCIERDPETGARAPFAITAEQLGAFLCRIFDRWLPLGPQQLSIRLFDSILSYYLNGHHTNCTFQERCGDYLVIEHNGDVFCCDFFVTDEWRLGNVHEAALPELFQCETKRRFARLKRQVANACVLCRHRPICQGGCLKDRIALTDDYSAPTHFCAAYRQLFDHALPHLQQLAGDLATRGPEPAPATRRKRRRR